jgi:hypothetical protein
MSVVAWSSPRRRDLSPAGDGRRECADPVGAGSNVSQDESTRRTIVGFTQADTSSYETARLGRSSTKDVCTGYPQIIQNLTSTDCHTLTPSLSSVGYRVSQQYGNNQHAIRSRPNGNRGSSRAFLQSRGPRVGWARRKSRRLLFRFCRGPR